MRVTTLMADDEPLARERLRLLLNADEEIEIAGECRNAREVVTELKAKQIDLLFLDIQMPGKTGFAIFEELGQARMPLTVFVTAHTQYAVKAFDVQALDYLTKPIEAERLERTLELVKERMKSKAAVATQETFASALAGLRNRNGEQERYPRRLLAPNGVKNTFVTVNEIEWIEAADYYSCLHVGANQYLLQMTIKEMANLLDPGRFVRIHRSAIVNVERVREIFREGKSEGSVVLAGGRSLRMSKAGCQRLLEVAGRK
jgi:two-component system, LytTR family, response regulator